MKTGWGWWSLMLGLHVLRWPAPRPMDNKCRNADDDHHRRDHDIERQREILIRPSLKWPNEESLLQPFPHQREGRWLHAPDSNRRRDRMPESECGRRTAGLARRPGRIHGRWTA